LEGLVQWVDLIETYSAVEILYIFAYAIDGFGKFSVVLSDAFVHIIDL
jgi:hypothetical protein